MTLKLSYAVYAKGILLSFLSKPGLQLWPSNLGYTVYDMVLIHLKESSWKVVLVKYIFPQDTYHANKADYKESDVITSSVIALSLSSKDGEVVALTLNVVVFIALKKIREKERPLTAQSNCICDLTEAIESLFL